MYFEALGVPYFYEEQAIIQAAQVSQAQAYAHVSCVVFANTTHTACLPASLSALPARAPAALASRVCQVCARLLSVLAPCVPSVRAVAECARTAYAKCARGC